MNDFEIETGVPIPANAIKHQYPFSQMDVGDSFYVSPDKPITKASVWGSASLYGKKHGKKFVVRKDGEGFRVWRAV